MLGLDSAKNGEEFWVLSQIRKTVKKIVFSEEVLSLANNSSLLRIDHSDDSGKTILICAGEDCQYLLRGWTSFSFYDAQ